MVQKRGEFRRSSFQKIGLIDKRTCAPNKQGGILVGLSKGKKLPVANISSKDAVSMSRLRGALKTLTGITTDPFLPYIDVDGWKPRFRLIDDRRNAAERAKAKAHHVAFDETRDFDDEDDEAGQYLREHE